MNLNNFEIKLNTDTYIKDDVRELLNYTFELKARLENREERLELIREQRDILKENKEELLLMLVKIAYCGWSIQELEKLLSKYGNYNDYEESETEE